VQLAVAVVAIAAVACIVVAAIGAVAVAELFVLGTRRAAPRRELASS
jgi:hypothetical protein